MTIPAIEINNRLIPKTVRRIKKEEIIRIVENAAFKKCPRARLLLSSLGQQPPTHRN
jgi:hypothetical protein